MADPVVDNSDDNVHGCSVHSSPETPEDSNEGSDDDITPIGNWHFKIIDSSLYNNNLSRIFFCSI